MKPNVLILRAPGVNCNEETAFAFEQAGAVTEQVHLNRLLEEPRLLDKFQVLCFPGGFSYGDDVAAGRILANQIRHHLHGAMTDFIAADKLILGICNGFQALIKSGILIADDATGPVVTLHGNDAETVHDNWVRLSVTGGKCVFLKGITSMYLQVPLSEGRFVTRDAATLDTLEANGQLVLRYEPEDNPNGSQGNTAGLCDVTGRVFGLMPHPERYITATQHPHWTRLATSDPNAPGDGLAVFQNAVNYWT